MSCNFGKFSLKKLQQKIFTSQKIQTIEDKNGISLIKEIISNNMIFLDKVSVTKLYLC